VAQNNTLRDLTERLSDARLNQDVLSRLPYDELMAELTVIPGIGPWTVQGALIIALQREDRRAAWRPRAP
jgi:DNA-3-methyladenine glycosylase II